MTEPSSHPSRQLRLVAGCARWALALLVALWLLLAAAWGALHGWIVPRIGDYRLELQAQAERALGVPVRIAAITARSEGLIPTVELSGVALLDAQGREALQLRRVVLALSPRSLLRLGFEQIYIEGPELDIRRAADGRITMAGLDFNTNAQGDSRAADWLFAQTEVALRGGTLRWTDEQRAAAPLALADVDLVLRNGGWRHALRLDATPPPEWGERFSVRGSFRQPLLTTHGGNWKRWNGELYAMFAQVDVSRLNQVADLGAWRVSEGRGALRGWVQVQRGQPVGATVDMALDEVNATLGEKLQPLMLRQLTGRLEGRRLEGGFDLGARNLQFEADDGLRWSSGNLQLRHLARGAAGQEEGALQADSLDLAAMAQIASRLPLDDAAHALLQTYAPRGMVQQLQAGWHGPLQQPQQYQLRARVSGLALAAQGQAPKVAGLSGANLNLDLTQKGGRAELAMADGALLLPGVFEDPVLPLQRLSATVLWQIEGQRIAVQSNDLRFANADAEGQARLAWRTADAATSPARARLPGLLEVTGNLTRADGTRVHRYLPLAIPAETRHYVRDAIQAGSASEVQFRVKGDLHDFPYGHAPGRGEFHIAARVAGVTYAYVPPSLLAPGDRPWPVLADLAGELVFDRASMLVRNATGSFAGQPAVRIPKVGAKIADLEHSVVEVDGQVRGPLQDMLGLVSGSHISQLTQGALDRATASGAADLQLALKLPLAKLAQSSVRGSVTLAGNEVRFVPEAPTVTAARGAVQFTETGFTLAGVQGRALGGEVRLEGGMGVVPAGAPPDSAVRVRVRGSASAEGLRATPQLGLLARLGQHASGSTAYTLNLGVRRGQAQIEVHTDLVGMALAAPAPLGKSAQAPLAVRFDNRLTPEAAASDSAPLQNQLTLELGDVARLDYVRALNGEQARVLRGAVSVGLPAAQAMALPQQGVAANAQLDELDVDAWSDWLGPQQAAAGGVGAAGEQSQDYLPDRLALRAGTLVLQGRSLHEVVAGVSRAGAAWRANVTARELDGFVEYRAAEGGAQQEALHARLSRLALPQSSESQVNALLDAQQPARLPALDIAVQDFELRGRRLGRLDIEARNRATQDGQREWLLSRFNLTAPEASFSSSGSWALIGGAGQAAERRTRMDFALDIRDSGALLARFGMDGVLRRGKGSIAGQVGWQGSPLSPDYLSMTGQVHVDVEAGQFLKADPGLAKLLGVLSLQSLPRRFALDFRDVFSEGFAFDFVRGDVRIDKGVASTNNLQMKGVSAAVLMEGKADIEHETQDLHVVVVPEINAMTASLVATAINPVVGLGSFLAQVFLRGPLIQAATQEFHIDGTWAEPRVERIQARKAKPGDDDAHGAAITQPGGKP
ncbi:MAG: TIGR02099 family protein [Proteobacteria bacterium]|nr:TIGR02099 family protein [Pseudomonadota bacterium]